MKNNTFLLLICIFFGCDKNQNDLNCDPELLDGHNKGQTIGEINGKESVTYSNYFRFYYDNRKIAFFLNKPHHSNCFNEATYEIRFFKEELFIEADTIFIRDANYYVSPSGHVLEGAYHPDTLKLENNWLIIEEINSDTSLISGELNLDMVRGLPDLSIDDPELPISFNLTNTSFLSEIK